MKPSHVALVLLSIAAVPARARAGVVLTLDSSRCYSGTYQYWLTGNGMAGPLAQLLSHGYTVQETNTISAGTLAGVDVLVLGLMNLGSTLSASEAADLQTWVAGGGGLLYIGDNNSWSAVNQQIGSLVQGADYGGYYPGSSASLLIVAPGHPVISGSFGTVNSITGVAAASYWINPATNATVVADNPDGTIALVAVDYGSGHALLLNDVGYFGYPPTYSADNAILWDNAIEWLDNGGSSVGSFCFGDGTQTAPCPCGNSGMPGRGCDNSSATGGARLTFTGTTSPDTIVLHSTGEKPTAPSIFLQGTLAIAPLPFGDGLRCVHGVLKRLYVKPAVNGDVAAPGVGDPSISVRSAALGDPLVPGATRWYQTYYRDPDPLFCASPTGSTFNVSNGLSILW